MSNCIFCKIANGDIPSEKVYEDDKIFVFKDIKPEAPVHILIIPKKHIESLNDIQEYDGDIISHIFLKAKDIAKELGIEKSGYRIVSNCGEHGGQTVFHIHFHLIGGRELAWPPG
jgi:histidine triad (HIT) family protein